ncbi:AhpC/TSA family protein [Flavobacterium sp. MAH-1]|uniref:AhpC/TSA family protein n=1 Tax=Flavobacterium agri TaxID=2743471 RepID=A0A7Y8XZT9_9FLAO|nr:TlpA disulfide reductase family protein [Flavobacterium agri]NUY79853.1 AhpC/TSA family protein [Flavobacterium agri]NYA69878.1 AhpC/TSA family protein [Flavobacterium agri]
MKKAFLALAIPTLFVACNSVGDNEFVLKGTVSGVDGKNIILKRQDDSLGQVNLDTVKIEKGKFEFKGTINEPEMYGLQIQDQPNVSPFIAENGEIEIAINKDSIFKNKISGTFNNEKFTEYGEFSTKLTKGIGDKWKKLQPEYLKAQSSKDTAAMRKIQTQMENMQKDLGTQMTNWAKSNPKAYISIFLIQNGFRAFEPNIEEIETLYNNLDPELKKTKAGKKLGENIKKFKVVEVGRRAPEFSATTPDGKTVSLKDARGKVTLIDFWASWCGPCRKANPELVALYNELHPKGLNIIGVSLDKPGQADKWKEAIAKDGLTWTQVSNLKEWKDPIAMRYGVEAIPSSFIVNQYGVVVGKDLHGAELKKKIEEWLAKPDVPK